MDREIDELLHELANITKVKQAKTRKKFYRIFFSELTLGELANLEGYVTALKESCRTVATNKILKGDHL